MKLQIIPSVDGRDRWALVWGNTIRRIWLAPRWMSWRSRAIVRSTSKN